MPIGLTNALVTYQALVNNVLRVYLDKFVIAYLDDILVYSNILKEHVEHVKTILTCLENIRLQLALDKCEFHKQEVEFLGYKVRIHRVRISEDKI